MCFFGYFHMEAKSLPLCPPPTHREILKKGQVCPYTFCCYINGWCFLDLQWTFYRALLPIYIKKDSGVFVTHLARAAILTDSCQVFVLQLYLCNDSVLIMLYYDHCPVPMYLKCSDYFVFISTNEILDIQMSHRQLLWFVTYFNCICYMLPTIWGKYMSVDYYIMITSLSQCT